MADGKKQPRPRRTAKGRRPVERRVPPSDATGREAAFFRKRAGSGSAVVIHLASGEVVRGAIERFDRDMITVGRDEGSALVLRKRDIRYIEES